MASWGDGSRLANLSPGAESNPRLRAWYGKLERFAAAPGMATKLMPMNSDEVASELDEIEEFLTGARHADDAERILATVMFADVVDSTRTAARVGDGVARHPGRPEGGPGTMAALRRRGLSRHREGR